MADGNIRSKNALCFVVASDDGTSVELIPVNDVGNDELAKFDTAHNTVVVAKNDAGRDGYKETARQPYKTVNLALSTV